MGDINGSYNPDDNNKPATFTVIKATDTAVNKGETYELQLKSDRNQNLLAVNLEFNIKDAGIYNIRCDVVNCLDSTKMNHVTIKDGVVKISWSINLFDIPQGVSLRITKIS
jgi:hypothetical protein